MKFVQQVCPMTQHPVMAKAAHYFGLTIKHVPVGPDYKADVRKMEQVGSNYHWIKSVVLFYFGLFINRKRLQ